MATRRPLVLVSGRVKELPQGDSVPGAGGSANLSSVTLDFGSTPVFAKSFTFADAGAIAGAAVLMSAAADTDEYEMDALACGASCPTNGSVLAVIHAVPGPIVGTRTFTYSVG